MFMGREKQERKQLVKQLQYEIQTIRMSGSFLHVPAATKSDVTSLQAELAALKSAKARKERDERDRKEEERRRAEDERRVREADERQRRAEEAQRENTTNVVGGCIAAGALAFGAYVLAPVVVPVAIVGGCVVGAAAAADINHSNNARDVAMRSIEASREQHSLGNNLIGSDSPRYLIEYPDSD